MSATILDGNALAEKLRAELAADIAQLSYKPGLAAILVGDDPASHVYVSRKIKACDSVGIASFEHRLPEDCQPSDIANLIATLNAAPDVHGILLQLPLPAHLDADPLIQMIAPEKDVDGLTLSNIGKLVANLPGGLVPCTPQGSMRLIRQALGDNLSGKLAVVIGRSLLFGKPMAQLLLQADCTVIQAHSRTQDLPGLCRQADIVVAAVGRAGMVKGDWIKPGACVIDVGINRMPDGKLQGDVAFDEAVNIAGAITPVPKGVGPMTVACLLANTLQAAKALNA